MEYKAYKFDTKTATLAKIEEMNEHYKARFKGRKCSFEPFKHKSSWYIFHDPVIEGFLGTTNLKTITINE